MWMIVSGLFSLIIAIIIGAYRHFCITMEVKASWNIPHIWRYSLARGLSLILVAGTTMWSAFAITTPLRVMVNDYIGKFSFGILILLRWIISARIGQSKANNALDGFAEFESTDEYKDILDEGEKIKQEYLAREQRE